MLFRAALAVLTACEGSGADRDYVKWAGTGITRPKDAAADYQEKASASASIEDSIQYAEQMTSITEGIAGPKAGIEQPQAQSGGG